MHAQPNDITMSRWVRATWLGWLLGVPMVILLALVGEAVGIGGAQFIVGAGIGIGVGWLQGRAIRPLLGAAWPWVWSCAVGLALPFLVTDLATLMERPVEFSLSRAVAAGGLLVGIWQALLLHRRVRGTGWWVFASALGWTLAAAAAAVADLVSQRHLLRGLGGALVYLALVALGGGVLGAVTGAALVRLPRRDAAGR